MKICTLFASTLLLSVAVGNTYATTYNMPPTPGDRVITQYPDGMPLTRAEQDETLLDVARQFLLGQMEIVRLNQDVDRWRVKKGEIVRVSNRRILPDTPHEGITLNISEYRMYYYPPNQPGVVMSFAHGIGRQDWKTPLGKTSVGRKVKDPVWHPPESIRREHAANGDPLPEIVPAGPHNPLGAFALYLNLPGEYRIHGTDIDKIYGIGMQITHGCVRMYPEDIAELYKTVEVGTPVYMVKQPIKVGWLDNVLYIEAHPDLEGEEMTQDQRYAVALQLIQKANNNEIPDFDQTILNEALTKLDGDPVALYERLPPLEEATPAVPPTAAPILPVKPVKAAFSAPAKPLPVKAKPDLAKPVLAKTDKKVLKKTAGKPIDALPVAAKSVKGKTVAAKASSSKAPAKAVAAAPKAKSATKVAAIKAAPARKGSPGGYHHGS
ncbi:L,D-transpeptidase family protein [Methylovulum psychrotolerans]|uniref:L,D-transpeptidase family protein n=1 Tax=Methylovulum psychrotolerans TaxID=1704499 RepID=UPI001BFF56F1|nr:L,D-transpeptidase family protein [Methylovulum psychrotolerans]